MPRFECERDDIPKKWTVLDLIPGEGDEWLLLVSNGVVDPAGNEMTINQPAMEAKGTFDEVSAVRDKKRQELEKELGYHLVQEQNDDDELPQP